MYYQFAVTLPIARMNALAELIETAKTQAKTR